MRDSTAVSPDQISARYALLCRATQIKPSNARAQIIEEKLDALQKLLQHDLRTLARRGSPDNFADIYHALEQELTNLRELCAFPHLAGKVTIGFGGAFSAGKSSLINAILGQRLLATEVDPTTSLPTFLLKGDEDQVLALNLHRHCINLTHEEFLSLTHDEMDIYGSSVASLLRAAFRTQINFPWENLALIDTPGYSKPNTDTYSDRTDEHVARAQLNAVQAIVWVISADAGTISEDDLQFLGSLRPDIPRLVVISRADKKPAHDIANITALISRTLVERNLPALAVIPFSNRNKSEFPLAPILAQLDTWNTAPKEIQIARNFKRQFMHYTRFITEQQRISQLHINRLNRILALADTSDIQDDAEELRQSVKARHTGLSQLADELYQLQQRFFTMLANVGESVDINLPEPAEIDMIELQQVNLLKMLREIRESSGDSEPDYLRYWRKLEGEIPKERMAQLMRRTAYRHLAKIQRLSDVDHAFDVQPSALSKLATLLQQQSKSIMTNIG
ncbi:dynamin family protein [Undibacterium sp. WLX3042]|uniref:dynamin family protein n=1 Tax=Undibacterium sp. WLX3042 TaxID=3412686 RepID=UPI003C2D4F5B